MSNGFNPHTARERATHAAGMATRASNSGEAQMALDVLDLLDLVAHHDAAAGRWEKIATVAQKLLSAATSVVEEQKNAIDALRRELHVRG